MTNKGNYTSDKQRELHLRQTKGTTPQTNKGNYTSEEQGNYSSEEIAIATIRLSRRWVVAGMTILWWGETPCPKNPDMGHPASAKRYEKRAAPSGWRSPFGFGAVEG
jgi:hypothetical protein